MKTVVRAYPEGYSVYFRASPSTVCEISHTMGEDVCQVFNEGESITHPGVVLPNRVEEKLDDQDYADDAMIYLDPHIHPQFTFIGTDEILKRWVMAYMI